MLGFHVYREQAGQRIRLTPSLIRARFGSQTYRFVDRVAPRGTLRYWFQHLSLSGERTWSGPAAVQ